MKSLFPFRLFGAAPEETNALPSATTDAAAQVFPIAGTIHPVAESASALAQTLAQTPEDHQPSSPLLKTVAWVTAGAGAIAIGLVLGRELRNRYKFNRRTPYDFYAHSGDEQDLEFGVGI